MWSTVPSEDNSVKFWTSESHERTGRNIISLRASRQAEGLRISIHEEFHAITINVIFIPLNA